LAEIVLGAGMALFGRLAEPVRRQSAVLRHAATFVVQHAQAELRLGIARLGQRSPVAQRQCEFAFLEG